jgi:hypothetical protein
MVAYPGLACAAEPDRLCSNLVGIILFRSGVSPLGSTKGPRLLELMHLATAECTPPAP